jgi:hypothetical protein
MLRTENPFFDIQAAVAEEIVRPYAHRLHSCDDDACNICRGGLSYCEICKGAEGGMPIDCPGYQLTAGELNAIGRRERDFKDGQWVISGPHALIVASPVMTDEQLGEHVEQLNVKAADLVNKPPHYMGETMEVIDVLERLGLARNGYLMQTMAYILRHHRKGTPRDDLKKAIWYLRRNREKTGPSAHGMAPSELSSAEIAEDFGLPAWPFEGVIADIRRAAANPGPCRNHEWSAIVKIEAYLRDTVFPEETPVRRAS